MLLVVGIVSKLRIVLVAGACALVASVAGAQGAPEGRYPALPSLSQIEPLPEVEPLPEAPVAEYFDLDAFLVENAGPTCPDDCWTFQILPQGLIYKAYLADVKESRLGTQFFHEKDQGSLWDSTLGGRAGILRYGSLNTIWPQGWQVDLEGSAQVRLDTQEDRDLESADFRVGSILTYGYGPHRLKFGYYHISSHAGDELMTRDPTFDRINWVRDTLVLGYSLYWTDNLRFYSEAGWAFYSDVAEPWEFRFGFDYAPARPTGCRGAPFVAMNGHIRQELDFGGNLVVQAGWAWRGDHSSHLFRTGLHFYNGFSDQYEFYDNHEQQIGAGVWYDY
jgi:hypothetical protein